MTFKPYQLASIKLPTSTRRRVVEVISHPIVNDRGETIMVRMVPGEPTTMHEVEVSALLPYPRKRWCHIAEVRTGFCFPEDMLRSDGAALYDHTVPEVREDENGRAIYESLDKPVLVYRLSDRKSHTWTYARWASFSASVKTLQIKDLSKPT